MTIRKGGTRLKGPDNLRSFSLYFISLPNRNLSYFEIILAWFVFLKCDQYIGMLSP